MEERLIDILRRKNIHRAYSPICGNVIIKKISEDGIQVEEVSKTHATFVFRPDGRFREHGEKMLFPNEENRDWNSVGPEITMESIIEKMQEKGFTKEEIEYVSTFSEKPKAIGYYIEHEGQIDELIDEITSSFDYENIRTAMEATKWTWANLETPTEEEIENMLTRLLKELLSKYVDESDAFISTGGFTVGFRVYPCNDNSHDTFDDCVEVYAYFAMDEYNTAQ